MYGGEIGVRSYTKERGESAVGFLSYCGFVVFLKEMEDDSSYHSVDDHHERHDSCRHCLHYDVLLH